MVPLHSDGLATTVATQVTKPQTVRLRTPQRATVVVSRDISLVTAPTDAQMLLEVPQVLVQELGIRHATAAAIPATSHVTALSMVVWTALSATNAAARDTSPVTARMLPQLADSKAAPLADSRVDLHKLVAMVAEEDSVIVKCSAIAVVDMAT